MKLRHRVIRWLFTDDEKFLMNRAIDERMDYLFMEQFNNKDMRDSITSDINDYTKLRRIFETYLFW
jgi:hypothetical protein